MAVVKMFQVSARRARRGRGYGTLMRYAGLAARGAALWARGRALRAGVGAAVRGIRRARSVSRSTTAKRSRSSGSRVSFRKRVKTSKTSVGRRVFRTSGVYGGRFRRTGRVVKDVYAERGAVFLSEFGGTRSSSEVVTIGHSTCALQWVMLTWVRALVRRLFNMTGNYFDDFGNSVFTSISEYRISYGYGTVNTQGGVASLAFTTFDFDGGITFNQLSDRLMSLVLRDLQSVNGIGFVAEINLIDRNTGVDRVMARLPLNDMDFLFKIVSTLTVQNRTLALSGVDTAESTNVTNNPLYGHSYYTSKANYLAKDDNNLRDVTCDMNIGVLNQPAIGTIGEIVRPGYNFENCRRSGRQMIQPGKIRKSSLVSYWKFEANKFFMVFSDAINACNVTNAGLPNWNVSWNVCRVGVGKTMLFGFEKMLDSRSEGDTISIGWELNNSVGCIVRKKRNVVVPVVYNTTTPS